MTTVVPGANSFPERFCWFAIHQVESSHALTPTCYLVFSTMLAVLLGLIGPLTTWCVIWTHSDLDRILRVQLVYRWEEVVGDLRPPSGSPRPCSSLECPRLLGFPLAAVLREAWPLLFCPRLSRSTALETGVQGGEASEC